jgi:Skp family chaperone for outer membrane proteins
MFRKLSPLLTLLVLVAACDSGANRQAPPIPPAGTGTTNKSTGTNAAPPASYGSGFLNELRARVDREWPAIEESGKAFLEKYSEVEKLHAAGDRAAMGTAIKEATADFEKANEAWAEIYNEIDDKLDAKKIDETTAEQCKKYLRDKNAMVTGWVAKAAAMSKFSTR